MAKIFIDPRAIEFMKESLKKENADSIRLFIGGGGCCKRFELAPVKKPIAGDISMVQDGIRLHIEKELLDNTGCIEIKFDDKNRLHINFK